MLMLLVVRADQPGEAGELHGLPQGQNYSHRLREAHLRSQVNQDGASSMVSKSTDSQ